MQIIITMDGGVIQDVTADAEVDLTVIDYDTEGVDADRLTTMQHENGWGSSAVVFDPGVTVDPEHVATITAYLSSGEGEQPAAPQEGQQTKPQSKVGQYISCQTCHKPAGDQATKDSGTCQDCTGRIIREGRQREANRANLRAHLAANS